MESLNIKPQGDYQQKLVIAFNIKYVDQALKFIPTNEVLINVNQPTTPVILTPVDGILNQLILVMPVELIGNSEVIAEVDVAADEDVMEETVNEENSELAANPSLPKTVGKTMVNPIPPANSTPKARGRKKKVAAA